MASRNTIEMPLHRPAGCRPYKPSFKDKVCAYSFIKEKDLPAGQKLFACGRCMEVWYVDRESQKKDWVETHKYVCCSIEKDDPRVRNGFNDITQCFAALEEVQLNWLVHKAFPKGRLFFHALKEIGHYCIEMKSNQKSQDKNAEFESLHFLLGNFRKNFSLLGREESYERFYKLLWSVPGFASHFLSDDIYLSPCLKKMKEDGLPPPDGFEIGLELLKDQTKMLFVNVSDEERRIALDSEYSLTIAHIHAMSLGSRCLSEDRALDAALMRTVFSFWKCPYARQSFLPDAQCELNDSIFTRLSLVWTFLLGSDAFTWTSKYQKWLRNDEFLPGLTFKEILSTIMQDKCFFLVQRQMIDTLRERLWECVDQLENSHALRKHLSVEDRWDLFETWSTWKVPPIQQMPIPFNGRLVDLGTLYGTIFLPPFSDETFKLYDVAKSSICEEDPSPQKQKLVSIVERRRAAALQSSKPLAALYAKTMQEMYSECAVPSGTDGISLPEDAEVLIAEFAADEVITEVFRV